MSAFSPGDTVQIDPAIVATSYPHLADLIGVVEKVFTNENDDEFHLVAFQLDDVDRGFCPTLTEAEPQGVAILDPEDAPTWYVDAWELE